MGRRLRTNVHVHDDNGTSHVFTPRDDVPQWAAERITNPKAWADDEATNDDGPGDGEPPRSGAGSGKAAWAEHAASLGLEVPEGATREDIIAAVDAANEQQ